MISMTPEAAQQVHALRAAEPDGSNKHLRVQVTKGGCSGLSYKLDFDQELKPSDKVFESHGEKLVIDTQSYLYVIGMTLDYSGGLNGRGFVFTNPNASKTCGCGSSFAV